MTYAASNSFSAQSVAEQPPIESMPVGATGVCADSHLQRNAMTDAELEQHIQDCGRHMLEAMAQGNRQAADEWLQAQTVAINSRSPAQVARMEAERGLLPEPCYFDTQGEIDRGQLPAMLRGQAA